MFCICLYFINSHECNVYECTSFQYGLLRINPRIKEVTLILLKNFYNSPFFKRNTKFLQIIDGTETFQRVTIKDTLRNTARTWETISRKALKNI